MFQYTCIYLNNKILSLLLHRLLKVASIAEQIHNPHKRVRHIGNFQSTSTVISFSLLSVGLYASKYFAITTSISFSGSTAFTRSTSRIKIRPHTQIVNMIMSTGSDFNQTVDPHVWYCLRNFEVHLIDLC